MTQLSHFLMCPPDHYGVEYEINPWMDRRRSARSALALQQWLALRQLLEEHGAKVSCLTPVAGLPDLVFTANAGLVKRNMVVLAQFRPVERRGEEEHFRRWFAEHDFPIHTLPRGTFFEGAGDAIFCGDVLFTGYRMRSDIVAHRLLGELLKCRVIPLELVDPRYYHLDTCFCPVSRDTAIGHPPAFDAYGQRVVQAMIRDLISVDEGEARRLACNAIVVGGSVVTNCGCPNLGRELRDRGWQHRETPLDEFLKAGGSARCLTLPLSEEQGAERNVLGDAMSAGGCRQP